MVYLLEDGRQFTDKQFIQEGEQFIEIPDFINPVKEDGFVVYVVGIEDGKPKYAKEPVVTPKPQPTVEEQILSGVNSSNESQLIIMEALATQYEEGIQNDLNNKEVLATIYEELLAQKEVK